MHAWESLEQTINGQRWRYVDTQPDGDKPVAVLLHGFTLGSSLLTYAPLVASLQPDYRVIVPDLPGFGGSDALKPIRLIVMRTLKRWQRLLRRWRSSRSPWWPFQWAAQSRCGI